MESKIDGVVSAQGSGAGSGLERHVQRSRSSDSGEFHFPIAQPESYDSAVVGTKEKGRCR
jgi:hypothetical protein